MNNSLQNPLVSIITVNFNNAELTCQLIESLKKISYSNIEIIVVDNASIYPPEIIKIKYPEIVVIQNEINKGFAGGNNDGFRVANGKYLMMLNNDTEVSVNFLEPLIELMESDASIGAVSPKICYHSLPKLIQFAGGNGINYYTGRGKFTGVKEQDLGQFNQCRKVEHTHGAAMLISRKAIEKAGLLFEDYFLYYEELDYCERIKKVGFTIWYEGLSVVYHKESSSVGKGSPMKIYYQTRNRFLYMQRNTNSFNFSIYLLFFMCFSVPKNSLKYIKAQEYEQLSAFYNGIYSYIFRKFGQRKI